MTDAFRPGFLLGGALALLGLVAPSGCDESNDFARCPLGEELEASCLSGGDRQTELTCVTEHPLCDGGYCVTWRQSGEADRAAETSGQVQPFCTMGCDGDADCPAGSSCELDPAGGSDDDREGSARVCIPSAVQGGGGRAPDAGDAGGADAAEDGS